MHFTAAALAAVVLATSTVASPVDSFSRRDADDNNNPDVNIFPNFNNYDQCKQLPDAKIICPASECSRYILPFRPLLHDPYPS